MGAGQSPNGKNEHDGEKDDAKNHPHGLSALARRRSGAGIGPRRVRLLGIGGLGIGLLLGVRLLKPLRLRAVHRLRLRLLGENLLVRRRLRLRRNLRLPNLPLHQGSLPAVGICGRFLVVVSIGHARFSFVFAACLSARAQMRTHHMETW